MEAKGGLEWSLCDVLSQTLIMHGSKYALHTNTLPFLGPEKQTQYQIEGDRKWGLHKDYMFI